MVTIYGHAQLLLLRLEHLCRMMRMCSQAQAVRPGLLATKEPTLLPDNPTDLADPVVCDVRLIATLLAFSGTVDFAS